MRVWMKIGICLLVLLLILATGFASVALLEDDYLRGPQGEPGIQGVAGVDGKDGLNGKDGVNGTDGRTPVKGEDYFTEEDVQDIVDRVLESMNGSGETDPEQPVEPEGPPVVLEGRKVYLVKDTPVNNVFNCGAPYELLSGKTIYAEYWETSSDVYYYGSTTFGVDAAVSFKIGDGIVATSIGGEAWSVDASGMNLSDEYYVSIYYVEEEPVGEKLYLVQDVSSSEITVIAASDVVYGRRYCIEGKSYSDSEYSFYGSKVYGEDSFSIANAVVTLNENGELLFDVSNCDFASMGSYNIYYIAE